MEYSPDQITGYRFINDRFYSAQIIPGSFVEVLVHGKLSFFRDGYDFYIQKVGDTLIRLETKEIRDTVYDKGSMRVVLRHDTKWKEILASITSDCINAYNSLKDLALTENNLTRFAISYNLCSGSEYEEYKEKKNWAKFNFGISTGLSFVSLAFKNKAYSFDYLDDKYQSVSPVYGLDITFTSPRINERLSLQTGFYYTESCFHTLLILDKPSAKEYNDSYFKFSAFSLPVAVRYNFPAGGYSLYLNVGTDLSLYFKTESTISTESVTGNVVEILDRQPLEFVSNPAGITGGAGINKTFKNFNIGISFQYYRSFMINTTNGFGSDINRISLDLVITN